MLAAEAHLRCVRSGWNHGSLPENSASGAERLSVAEGTGGGRSEDTQRILVLITMSMCTMLYALTLTIVNVVLPQMQGALSASPDQISWVVTLNVVATAVVTPMTGWFATRFGQRRVILWSVVGFSISSLLCATATTLPPLLLYRVGQGIFGAPLVPLSQAIVVAAFPPSKRAMAQGVFGMSVVIGPAIAPALGGYLAEAYGWQWVFLLILPLCVAAFIGVLLFIHDKQRSEAVRLDWTGFLTLSIAVCCLQLIMDRGHRLDWLESGEIVTLTTVLALCAFIFLVHTATHDRPFINPELFRDRNFDVGLLLVFVYGMINVTPTVMFPALLQNLKGFPDSLIGTLLAMRGGGMVLGFLAASRMGRLDPRLSIAVGLICIGLSGWNSASFDLNVSAAEVGWTGVLQGFGCGVMWVPLSVITFATLSDRLLPDAAAIFHLLRNFGSSIFISLSVLAVVRSGSTNYAELTEQLNVFSKSLHLPSVVGVWNFESLPSLAALSQEVARQASMIGYANAFLLYTLACFVSLPLIFFVRVGRTR